MGRIAEALKRAEDERRRRLAEQSGAATALLDPPDGEHVTLDEQVSDFRVVEPQAPELALEQGIHESVVAYYSRSSAISEQYRSLRTRLLTQNPQNDHRVLTITSAIPREGKSVTTANMGMIMAEIRHFKVLIVDCDFRRSRLGLLFDSQKRPGLADLLRGAATYDEVVQPTCVPNLYLANAGQTNGRSAAELLATPQSAATLRRFQSEFHYTFIDTPPATTVTDVGIIGQMCNGVILLVRLKFTPEAYARRAVRLLRVNKIPILGCLLIGQDERPSGGYGYRYAYDYYRYGYSRSGPGKSRNPR